jgi:CDP-paratose 2-epimerase
MSVAVVTGAAGLVGSEAALRFGSMGFDVVGIDNDMRATFFGPEASTISTGRHLRTVLGRRYEHHDVDVRDRSAIEALFGRYGPSIEVVVHTAAQPSHDWAASEPFTDFDVNAGGTLAVLEATRRHAPDAPFIYTSTNKVYGDRPNELPLEEGPTRFELAVDHPYYEGVREDMSIDATMHSLFGASKTAADVLVQEYGRYFSMPTACVRGGTLTGPRHAAAELHGFLAYLMRCTMARRPYRVIGYGGKQVRDALHAADLVEAFVRFQAAPRVAAVYNLGGGRTSNCSVLEAIELAQEIAGVELDWTADGEARAGDHLWWIGSNRTFMDDYPGWVVTRDVKAILAEMADANAEHWTPGAG